MTRDEAPHFMAPRKDCMGNPTFGYWRQFLLCSDKNYIIGHGQTKEEAEINARMRRQERETELNLSPKVRLKKLAEGDLCDRDMKEALRLIIQILIENKSI